MNSTRDEGNEYSNIDYDCLAVDRESTNLTSRSQLRSSEGNIRKEPSSAMKKREQKAVEETLSLVEKEEGKKQSFLESIIFSEIFKIGLPILFILLISVLVLLFFYNASDFEKARINVSFLIYDMDKWKLELDSHNDYIYQLQNKSNELTPEHTSVMLLGGWHIDITNSITIYNSMEKSWKNCKLTLPITLGGHGAALLNNEIYIFGGIEDGTAQEPLKSLYKLGVGNKWKRMADMNEKRCLISQSSVVFNSEIWVIGGRNETYILKSVEKFNPITKKWTEMPELNEPRMAAAATVIDGKIYVSGGWGKRTENSVEVYDPEKGKWEIFTPSMPYGMHSHILIGKDSHLIAIGGDLSFQEPTNQVWKIDVLDPKREWKEMPFLQQKRYFSGAVIIADELMIFGGATTSTDRIDSVEIFDGVEWKDGANLPEIRGFFGYIPLTCAQERLFLKRFCQDS